jgi:hypothetical protein
MNSWSPTIGTISFNARAVRRLSMAATSTGDAGSQTTQAPPSPSTRTATRYENGANPPEGLIQDEQEDPLEDSCVEDCLGPDDPSIGPWQNDFYD